MLKVICVDPAQAHIYWNSAGPIIDRAVLRTNLSHTLDIETEVLNGTSLLWMGLEDGVLRGAMTTTLINTDASKICLVTAFSAENMESWLPLIHRLEDYAKAEGCNYLRLYGRKGWERVLDGYKATHAVIEKALN